MSNEAHSARVLDFMKRYSVRIAPAGEMFTLASGEKSQFFIDVKKTALHASVHRSLAYMLYDELAHGHFGAVQAVAGVALGGCHLASITAMHASFEGKTPLNVAFVRKVAKDHGTKNLVECPSMTIDERVVLLEDVVTTGGSSLKAAQALRDVGYNVCGILAVIDRRKERTDSLDGIPLRSLFTLDNFKDMLPT